MYSIPDYVDNSEEGKRLCDILNTVIDERTDVYIASGYFNLKGFELIKEKLGKAKSVKLLIGRALSDGQIIGADNFLKELQNEVEENIDKEETSNLVKEFLDWLKKDIVEVKIYNKNFFHGKFYIIENIPIIGSIAISGSSNFTYSGFVKNTEWNVVQKEESTVKSAISKFYNLWNECDDFKEQLIKLYSGWFSTYTPFEIYLKTLYEYFKDKYNEVSVDNELPSPIILADFQKDGYTAACQALDNYGGVLIADSVGLGKTFLALKILDDYAYRLRQKALIIAPAQIIDTIWDPLTAKASIRVDIISQEKASREIDIEKYSNYDLIVIDESHNFRNSGTKRWRNLFEVILKNKNKKVILLTATPVNNGVFDLYNQLRLITRDKDDFFKAAGIPSLWGYFLKCETNKENLYDLLEEITVRRSRQFIKKYYPNSKIDNEPIKFPERELHTVTYSIEKTYQGIYDECAEAIENLILASYNIDIFRKNIYQKKPYSIEDLKLILEGLGISEQEMIKMLKDYGRNVSVISIMKILFLKRLESSVEAFRISIDRLLDYQKKFYDFLKDNKLLTKEDYRKIFINFGEDSEKEENQEILIENLKDINAEEYEIEEIKKAVNNDIFILEEIKEKIINFSKDEDDKSLQFKKLLRELKGKKIIIFGFFKDTIRYLYNNIINDASFLKDLNISKEKISITDSDVSPDERKNRIIRFAPISNDRPDIKEKGKEIDILFSTEVLSEGQNLQDAEVIINYDLPWNPVRLVQRIGRLDRLKCVPSKIFIYNFFPEDGLESILHILEKLFEKINSINRTVGLDASILGETPSPKDFTYIKAIYKENKETYDELERIAELGIGEELKEEMLNLISEIGEERIKRIPNGAGCFIKKDIYNGLFVAFKDKERHYWFYYDIKTRNILENKLEIIKIIRCRKNDQPVEFGFSPYEIIRRIKDKLIARLQTLEAKPSKLKSPQKQIIAWFQTLKKPPVDLIDYFSNPLPEIYLQELRKIYDPKINQDILLDILKKFKENYPIIPEERKELTEYKPELKLVSFIGFS